MNKGIIFKIHSDFYYIYEGNNVIECKIREILKKQKVSIAVGDVANYEKSDNLQGVIYSIDERKNYMSRPGVANVDQVIIVSSLKSPDLDFSQLDRYIALAEYCNIEAVLCFNKNDLIYDKLHVDEINNIYQKLGYKTVFISAKEKEGLDKLEEILANKISVLCGTSGVGKSSLINAIDDILNLKTKEVSLKTLRGTHTTRHSEIINIKLNNGDVGKIVDTPGFSCLKFDFLMPSELDNLFRELRDLKKFCKFKDCLHLNETDCNVIEKLDTINSSRYETYKELIEEAKKYKETVKKTGIKQESHIKYSGSKVYAKISTQKRKKNRNEFKQSINRVYIAEESGE